MKKRLLSLLMASSMILSSNVSAAFVSASDEEVGSNITTVDEKKPVSTEKCSEQLINAMNSDAAIFKVQILYLDVPIDEARERYEYITRLTEEYHIEHMSDDIDVYELIEKTRAYNEKLLTKLVYTKSEECAEQLLAEIDADVSKALILPTYSIIECELDLEQLTKALEQEQIYEIRLSSEVPDIQASRNTQAHVNNEVSPLTTTTVVPVNVTGDTNCDGVVTIADAAAIFQSLANPDKYKLSAQGEFNADSEGDGITVDDAVRIQKMLAGIK